MSDQTHIMNSGWGTSEIDPNCVTNWWYPPDHQFACICEAATPESAEHIAQSLNQSATVDALRLHLGRMLMAQDGVPLNAIEFSKWVDEARAFLAAIREGEA